MRVEEWNEVVFTDESRICLQHHDGRIRVWRHRGERMLNSCVMNRHTGPAPGIMVWGSIGYHSRTPLVRIAGTLNSQRYISEIVRVQYFVRGGFVGHRFRASSKHLYSHLPVDGFPDNAHSVAFSQRSSSPRLIEDETFNDSDIINNLINYEDTRRTGFFENG
ncbi:transposable element Tcb1 transposase [Trichonephila clavipes]|nr:transposable element Tcb1 transposase [Trichonephila clavipes]